MQGQVVVKCIAEISGVYREETASYIISKHKAPHKVNIQTLIDSWRYLSFVEILTCAIIYIVYILLQVLQARSKSSGLQESCSPFLRIDNLDHVIKRFIIVFIPLIFVLICN